MTTYTTTTTDHIVTPSITKKSTRKTSSTLTLTAKLHKDKKLNLNYTTDKTNLNDNIHNNNN